VHSSGFKSITLNGLKIRRYGVETKERFRAIFSKKFVANYHFVISLGFCVASLLVNLKEHL
jgi:hypothetical protein